MSTIVFGPVRILPFTLVLWSTIRIGLELLLLTMCTILGLMFSIVCTVLGLMFSIMCMVLVLMWSTMIHRGLVVIVIG